MFFLEVVDYIYQVVDGIVYVYGVGMVYCDIKFGNLLVDCSNIVKLFDLGFVRFFNDDGELLMGCGQFCEWFLCCFFGVVIVCAIGGGFQ